jgi:hypothetical protein
MGLAKLGSVPCIFTNPEFLATLLRIHSTFNKLWSCKQVLYITYYIFSYSASSQFSGITHDATAFVGCDAGKVCKIDLLPFLRCQQHHSRYVIYSLLWLVAILASAHSQNYLFFGNCLQHHLDIQTITVISITTCIILGYSNCKIPQISNIREFLWQFDIIDLLSYLR